MHPSLTKAKIFASLALIILTFSFTLPMIAFHGVLNKVEEGKGSEVSSFSKSIWNLYSQGRYKSVTTDKEAHNNLEKMIETQAELGAGSLPYSGEVHEMNTINHYVGMDPMWVGGTIEREIGIYALLALSLGMIYFIAYNNKILNYLMLIPASLPVLFIADYSYWLYWFGHNLHDWGAFKIKPFMPTVFGDGKIAQFVTHSYPTIGFYLIVAISLLSLLAFFSKQKAMREMQE